MPDIVIQTHEDADGWNANVRVRDGGETAYRVRVPRVAYERLAAGRDVEAFVRASFEFLLEREPKESILREFEIDVISRYFPEYETEIRRGSN